MKKFKFLMPMMAIVCTLAMSFASTKFVDNPSTDYIIKNGVCQDLNQEVPCTETGEFTCQVISASLGGTYQVFDDRNQTQQCIDLKSDITGIPIPIN